jgi:REP element-mobilizing transposase RayT
MKRPGYAALRKGRCSLVNHVYHLTAVTAHRTPFFNDFYLSRRLITALHEPAADAETLAYVVMPDHFHWLIRLQHEQADISRLVQGVKAKTTYYYRRQFGPRPIWQTGFHDRTLRRDEQILKVARYILANPLRAGIATRLGQYPHWDAIWV